MTNETPSPAPPHGPLRLEERVVAVLREHSGAIAFNGLRRALEAHPESLTRALRRLERWGRIARDGTGYRLSDGEEESIPDEIRGPNPVEKLSEPHRTPLAEIRLGPGVDGAQLLGQLAGRWTASLRWVGVYDQAREPLLAWSRSDGPGQLLLGFRNGRLRVYAERDLPGPVPPELHAAAQDLLIFALGRLRNLNPEPRLGGAPAFALRSPTRYFGPN